LKKDKVDEKKASLPDSRSKSTYSKPGKYKELNRKSSPSPVNVSEFMLGKSLKNSAKKSSKY